MKRIIFLFIIVFISVNVFSQSRPSNRVKKAFESKYPTGVIVRWENETEKNRITLWKAFFTLDDVISSAWYDPKGNWIQSKTKINESELPEAVLHSIKESYYTYKIVIAARFSNPETEGYEVFLDNGQDGFDVQYLEDGELVSRTIRSAGYHKIDNEGNEIKE